MAVAQIPPFPVQNPITSSVWSRFIIITGNHNSNSYIPVGRDVPRVAVSPVPMSPAAPTVGVVPARRRRGRPGVPVRRRGPPAAQRRRPRVLHGMEGGACRKKVYMRAMGLKTCGNKGLKLVQSCSDLWFTNYCNKMSHPNIWVHPMIHIHTPQAW